MEDARHKGTGHASMAPYVTQILQARTSCMQEMKWGTSMQFPCSGGLRNLLLVNSLHLGLSAFYRVVTVYQSLGNIDMSMVYLS
jgi:hypothetical protein